jgi:hypothetical protein
MSKGDGCPGVLSFGCLSSESSFGTGLGLGSNFLSCVFSGVDTFVYQARKPAGFCTGLVNIPAVGRANCDLDILPFQSALKYVASASG